MNVAAAMSLALREIISITFLGQTSSKVNPKSGKILLFNMKSSMNIQITGVLYTPQMILSKIQIFQGPLLGTCLWE